MLRTTPFLLLCLAAMVVVRLAMLGVPAGSDEAGFLMVGAGWDPGPSLYGDYWVDRPPLLILLMDLAGSVTALRLLGLLACIALVLGVARTAYVVRDASAARWAGAAAALMCSAPWLGVARTNGEMLAAPFVAWGFALTAQALLRPGPRSPFLALAAGGLAACAGLVKQTIADGIVFAVVLGLAIAWQDRARRRDVAAVLGAGAAGVVIALSIGLAAAATRGTTTPELFEALVRFRAEAGEVIRTSASHATTDRLLVLVATWVASGLALVTGLTVWVAWRRREPAVVAAAAVLTFVTAAAVLGGSYWAHYLLQLVPGASLAIGLLAGSVRARPRAALATVTVLATLGNVGWNVVVPPDEGVRAEVVGTWLRHSAQTSDTAVIAYGQPNVLSNAAMSSPYPYLWSLPVRTRDSDLSELARVLGGPDRPTWVVDWSGIRSWGVEPAKVTRALARHYRHVAQVCGRSVWLDERVDRTLARPAACP